MYKLPNGKIVYPEDVECVHDPKNGKGGIFIGNLEAAQNIQTLKKHGIKAVLTAAKGVFLNHPKTEIPYQLYIPGEDHDRFDISKFFHQSISFIHEALKTTNILVHCLAGVSRSVSLVMAYFIKHQGLSYNQVYSKIKSRRRIIHPNDGFISQLKKFEEECRTRGTYQVVSRNENALSCSPTKRQRVERGSYCQNLSPTRNYDPLRNNYFSPTKLRVSPQADVYTQMKESLHLQRQVSDIGNPELFKSFCKNPDHKVSQFSPTKLKQQRPKSSLALKKMHSLNVDFEGNIRSSFVGHITEGQREYDLFSSKHRHSPNKNIQNGPRCREQYKINQQIDRKIAEIRKKYQEYSQKQQNHQRLPEKREDLMYTEERNKLKKQNQLQVQESKLLQLRRQKLFSGYEREYQRGYEQSMRRDNFYQTKTKQDFWGPEKSRRHYMEPYVLEDTTNQVGNYSRFGGRLRRLQSYKI